MRRSMRWAIGTVVMFTLLPHAAASQPAALAGLDRYIEAGMGAWEVPGFAIAVVRNDSVLLARGFGVARLGAPERVDEHTLFAIASTTKAMTAASLAMLADEGRLDWDDPVQRFLPAFQLRDPYVTRELTIRDLLTHRSGLSRNDELWISAPFDRAEVLRRARHVDMAGGFRSTYGYNNIMYMAAGEVVGAASGTSWEDFLEQRLFTPLGMTRSTARTAVAESRGNIAASHIRTDSGVIAVPRRNYDHLGGAGAVFSSAHDMAQWLRLQLGAGEYGGRRLISAAAMQEMHEPQVVLRSDSTARRMSPTTNFRAYGLGWILQDYHGRKVVHHSGSVNWTRTQIIMVPDERIAVVAIANLNTSNLQLAAAWRVIDALLGLPARDWSADYLDLARRADERAAQQASEVEAARVADTRPSLAPAQYAGTYESPLHGTVRLEIAGDRLVLHYAPDYVADLEHWHFDTFRATWRREGFGRAFVSFALDTRGRPVTVTVGGLGEFRRVAARRP